MTAGVCSQREPRRTSAPPAWGRTRLASLVLMESGTRRSITEGAWLWVLPCKFEVKRAGPGPQTRTGHADLMAGKRLRHATVRLRSDDRIWGGGETEDRAASLHRDDALRRRRAVPSVEILRGNRW